MRENKLKWLGHVLNKEDIGVVRLVKIIMLEEKK